MQGKLHIPLERNKMENETMFVYIYDSQYGLDAGMFF
jgi:hypothetical protein